MVYFDANATTALCDAARSAWLEANEHHWHNPSSPYAAAARARVLLEQGREQLGQRLGCSPEPIVFNSGATEGNHSLFAYFKHLYPDTGTVLVSAVEHPSVLEAARFWFSDRLKILPVDAYGVVNLATLGRWLADGDVILVSVMAANNETGALQPWETVLKQCQKRGIPFHCDASQWIGKCPANGLGTCDFLTGCAHKFSGPKGVGFLKIAPAYSGFKSLIGGEQESRHRSGTEDYPAIAAMLAALSLRESMSRQPHLGTARDHFETVLQKELPGIQWVAQKAPRLWNTTSLILPAYDNLRWVRLLDKRGFAVSTGSACATGKEGSSHVLAAMGYAPEAIQRVIRISSSWETQSEDWEALAHAIIDVGNALQRESQQPGTSQVIEL